MQKTKKVLKKVLKPVTKLSSKKDSKDMPTWAKAINWMVLTACLVIGLYMMYTALSGLSNSTIDTNLNENSNKYYLWVYVFSFVTMGIAFYACIRIYYKNIAGYICFFLLLLFLLIWIGMVSPQFNAIDVSQQNIGTEDLPSFFSISSMATYICSIPTILLFTAFILMFKYLKPFTKQDIIIIALYIIFFIIFAPLNLSAAIEYARTFLVIK